MNEEALYSLHGGIAYEGDFPKCLPLSIIQSIQGICYHYIPEWIDYIDGKELVVAFTNNLSLSVLYQKTDDNVGIILLPKGLITRAYLLTKVVFSNLDKERKQFVRFAAPIPEDYTHHEIYIPPRLRPIFASYSDANMLLSEWEELNSSITIDELNNDFVEYTTVMIVLHIIFHELGHISRGHRTFLSLQKLASHESRNFLSIDKIKRALEIDSDKIAGQLMSKITALQIQEYKEKGNYIDHLPYIAYCTGFANMLVYSIMDVETRGLAAYKNSIYPHPTVRFLF
ncbi:MAG: hypothetical protein IPN33_14330 [Saprospiraceae bacterium]|nr:hypothetical protein [Saprospiraceae bacterium]